MAEDKRLRIGVILGVDFMAEDEPVGLWGSMVEPQPDEGVRAGRQPLHRSRSLAHHVINYRLFPPQRPRPT